MNRNYFVIGVIFLIVIILSIAWVHFSLPSEKEIQESFNLRKDLKFSSRQSLYLEMQDALVESKDYAYKAGLGASLALIALNIILLNILLRFKRAPSHKVSSGQK